MPRPPTREFNLSDAHNQSSADSSAPAEPAAVPVLPPLAAIVEIVVLYALILGTDAMLPNVDVTQIQPHPFWLPVLFLSLQYGTVSGLLAAASAIVVSLFYGMPEQDIGENLFVYLARAWVQPVLWIVAALALGILRMRQLEAKRSLQRAVFDLSHQRAALAKHAQALRRRCDDLERHIAGRRELPATAALAALDEARSAGNIADRLARLLDAAFPGCIGSLLIEKDDRLVEIAAHGRACGGTATDLAPTHALARAVVGDGRALGVLQRGDKVLLGPHALLAAPIEVARLGVVGLIRIERLAPEQLSAASLPALRAIAAAIAASVEPHVASRPDRAVVVPFPAEPVRPAAARWNRLHWMQGREPPETAPPVANEAGAAAVATSTKSSR